MMKRLAAAFTVLMCAAACDDTAQITKPEIAPPGVFSASTASASAGSFAYVVNGSPGTVSVIETTTNTLVATVVGVGVSPDNVAITPDGAFVYVTSESSNSVMVIETASNTVVATVVGVGGSPSDAAFTPNGAFAYVVNIDSDHVSVIETTGNTVVTTVSVEDRPADVTITPDGSLAYVPNFASNTISVIETTGHTVIAKLTGVGGSPRRLAITPDVEFIYVVNGKPSGTVTVIETATNMVVATVDVGDQPTSVTITSDGAFVYVVNAVSGTVSVIATDGNTVVATVEVGENPQNLAFTPDGAFAYVTNNNSHDVSVIATAGNTVVATLTGVFSNPRGIAITPSSQEAPEIATDTDPVVVEEGQTANNTGTVSDPDADVVSLTASVGIVTNNNDGTWSWSFDTSDGPAESQTVTIDADDGNGGEAQTMFELTVNNVDPTVTSVTVPGAPVAIDDQPVSASGDFTDPAGTDDETYTCTVDYGDGGGPQAGTVAGTTCTGPDQIYAAAGIYTVTVEVTDKDGGVGSLASEAFIVIYDPTGGFVTGGGWIDSPAGAFKADESLTGKANFGFVSRYKKGATIPTGRTEFQFKAGDLNFHSSSYDFLVITANDTRAQFKGEGTINGSGVFGFMIWADDDDPDAFRIRITEVGGGLVYDNGTPDIQPIGGGSIVIHTPKN